MNYCIGFIVLYANLVSVEIYAKKTEKDFLNMRTLDNA